MKYYIDSICSYIGKQVSAMEQSGARRLVLMIPSLTAGLTQKLAQSLEYQCGKNKVVLNFKVARELYSQWSESERSILKDYEAQGSLTELRNSLKDGVLVLGGTATVPDQGSLADFHQITEDRIWQVEMQKSFRGWLNTFFHLNGEQDGTEQDHFDVACKILEVLRKQYRLQNISDWLEKVNSVAGSVQDSLDNLLRNMKVFDLPNMSGFPRRRKKPKKFVQYLQNAHAFFDYSSFMENNKRKKFLSAINRFRDENKVIDDEESVCGMFHTRNNLLNALEHYIATNDREDLIRLKSCDFVYVVDEILEMKAGAKPKDESPVRKLQGSPVDVLLQAILQCLNDCRNGHLLKGLHIRGIKFVHDYDDDNELAKKDLNKLLGGLGEFLKNYIVLYAEDGVEEPVAISVDLMPDGLNYETAKNKEPRFEFEICVETEDGDDKKSHEFVMRLSELNPYRISCTLLSLADRGLAATSDYSLPIYQFPYYRELMAARDDDELYRILLHCVRDRQEPQDFLKNIYTKNWHDDNPAHEQLKQLAFSYRKFIEDTNKRGLYAALNFSSYSCNGEDYYTSLMDTYKAAVAFFINTEGVIQKGPQYAAMLMRAFLVLDDKPQKNVNENTWAGKLYEENGIVTILHPSVIEMLKDQCVFLAEAFSRLGTKLLCDKKPFNNDCWQRYVDMASIQMPLGGLLVDSNDKLSVNVRGKGLLHRIGSVEEKHATLTTRLMTRYDHLDDDDIKDSEIFRETSESRLLKNILEDFWRMHPHAQDALTLAVYRNDDVQPVLAAIDSYLKALTISELKKYDVRLILFSDFADQTGIVRWMEGWQERWEAAETEEKLKHYTYCRLSVEHRIVPKEADKRGFERLLRELNCDVMVFYNFIEAGRDGSKFHAVDKYDHLQNDRKFPILEKSFCTKSNPGARLMRSQIISNRQFFVNSGHAELMMRLKNQNTPAGQEHVIVGSGNFEPWQAVIDVAHRAAEWVVCIDSNIDDKLIREHRDGTETRQLIGFGSGVGLHGESNFTISSQIFSYSNLKGILQTAFRRVYHFTDCTEDNKHIVEQLLNEGTGLSGLSLIRALGPSYYVHDFLAYSIIKRMFLRDGGDYLCNQLFSVDTYAHWFDMKSADNKKHPDLLWVQARINERGQIEIDARLIECKMGKASDEHLKKAQEQIQNGLEVLMRAFTPRKEGKDSEPDARYWYLQMHRMIASCVLSNNIEDETVFLAAMERMAMGNFKIKWSAGIFAFWIGKHTPPLKLEDVYIVEVNGTEMEVPVCVVGYKYIRELCSEDSVDMLRWPIRRDELDSYSRLEQIVVEGQQEPEEEDEEQEEPVAGGFVIDWRKGRVQKPSLEPQLEPELEHPLLSQVSKLNKEDDTKQTGISTVRGNSTVLYPDEQDDKPPVFQAADPVAPNGVPDRIFLGTENDRRIYWEFGHEDLSNRHLLIFGNSGMGKTYAIQCILCEMGRKNLNNLIVDYTNGFLPEHLDAVTNNVLHPYQNIVKLDKLPVNPFRKTDLVLGGLQIPENSHDVAKRVAAILGSVYKDFGGQQKVIVIDSIKDGLEQMKNDFEMKHLLDILEGYLEDATRPKNSVTTIRNKLKSLIDEDLFVGQQACVSWDELFANTENRCQVFQMAGLDRETSRMLTEFTLWDLYVAARNSGQENKPKVVVLDEVQNLSQDLETPLGKILTEGRKFGLCLIAATQIMSGVDQAAKGRLFLAAHKLFFRPADTELKQTAELVKTASGRENVEYWSKKLSSLGKGQCLSLGPALNEQTGMLKPLEVHKLKITALTERGF